MKAAFRLYVKRWIERWSPERIIKVKSSLAYFIDNKNVLDMIVLANLPDLTMTQPKDVTRFFRWLWESLFPGEEIPKLNPSEVVENADVMETNKLPGELS